MAKILVVGATGHVGGMVARGLARAGHEVRAMARNPERAVSLATAGVTIVPGDLADPATLAAQCQDVDVVVSTATSMPTGANDGLRRVDLDGTLALIEAAERVGVERFVYTSYSGNVTYDSPLHTAKRTCEMRLLGSEMDVEILRPGYFMEVWLAQPLGIDIANGRARVYGDGQGKGNYVSAVNVADFAIAAAQRTEPGKHTVEIGGPEALSQLEALAEIEEITGKKLEREFVPRQAIEAQYQSASDPVQKTFAALMLAYMDGDVIPDSVLNAQKYGVKLHWVEDFVRSQVKAAAHGR